LNDLKFILTSDVKERFKLNIGQGSKIRVLREADLRKLLDVPTAIEIIERTYKEYGLNESHTLSNPPALYGGKGGLNDARYKVKGATLFNENVTGIRLISDLPVGLGFESYHLLLVYDDKSAAPLGLLDETWLHRFRTALTGVVACKYLAKSNSKIVALLGAGEIAKQLFPALEANFNFQEIRVVARRYENAKRFCKIIGERITAEMKALENAKVAVKDADIIITLTLADKPVVGPGLLSSGSFLCSMGETEEVEFEVLSEIDRFIVDEFEYATSLGDISQWIKSGSTTRDKVKKKVNGHIGQIIGGLIPGRQNDTERIFAIIQGMAICDLALANYALRKASEEGVGEIISIFNRV
tara:strand:+ start:20 stop:1087 length:1068 start_codon:yes stop_codon:yes gene_type:complete